MALLITVAIVPITSLAAWIAYLMFCRFLVKNTKDPASLDHAAIAAEGFRKGTASALAEVLGKLLSLRSK